MRLYAVGVSHRIRAVLVCDERWLPPRASSLIALVFEGAIWSDESDVPRIANWPHLAQGPPMRLLTNQLLTHAASQHAVVAKDTLTAAGLSDRQIHRLVESGVIEPTANC